MSDDDGNDHLQTVEKSLSTIKNDSQTIMQSPTSFDKLES